MSDFLGHEYNFETDASEKQEMHRRAAELKQVERRLADVDPLGKGFRLILAGEPVACGPPLFSIG